MKTADMCSSKTCVKFRRCYGNHGWAEAVEKIHRKLAPVGIIPNQILFAFSSDKDRRTDGRIRRKNTNRSSAED